MSKRFTDTAKWYNNKWFFNLTIEEKLFWVFICDSCDAVGVWEENIDLANRIIGYSYSIDTLLKSFSKQIYLFKNNRKWWIIDFCDFQYGILDENSTCKPIQSYIQILKSHGLWELYTKGIHTLKEKEKDKEQKKEKTVLNIPEFLQEIWPSFVEMRKKIKKPLTDKAIELTIKELKNLYPNNPEMQIKSIEQSIQRGWQGVFEIKKEAINGRPLTDKFDGLSEKLEDI